MTDLSAAARQPLWRFVVLGLLGFAFLSTLGAFALDLGPGGNVWKQGDWLINTFETNIRRGPVGTQILVLADATGLSPVHVVLGLQLLLLTAIYALLTRMALWPDMAPVVLLFVVCPAFFVLFWANDLQAGGRKEILGMAGVMLALWGAGAGRLWPVIVSAVIMAAGFVGHEVNLLLAPLYALILVGAARQNRLPKGPVFGLLAIVTLAGIAAFLYAVRFSHVADTGPICAPLLERGLPETFCSDGAIPWMSRTSNEDIDMVAACNLTDGLPAIFALAYVLASLPFAYLISRLENARRWAVFAALAVVPFLPLFVVALDWGRWMALHAFSAAVLMILALRLDWTRIVRPLDPRILALLIVIGLLWAERQIIGIRWGGTIGRGFEVLGQVLG